MIRALRFKTLACASALSLASGVGCSSTSSTSSTEPAPSTAALKLTPSSGQSDYAAAAAT